MKRNASFSAQTAPADSIHETPLIDASETTASNNIDAFVGADGIQAKKRGLSARITAGASTEVKRSSTTRGSFPVGVDQLPGARRPTSEGSTVPPSGAGSRATNSCRRSMIISANRRASASNAYIFDEVWVPRRGLVPGGSLSQEAGVAPFAAVGAHGQRLSRPARSGGGSRRDGGGERGPQLGQVVARGAAALQQAVRSVVGSILQEPQPW